MTYESRPVANPFTYEYKPEGLSWCGANGEEQDRALGTAKQNHADMEPAERAALDVATAWEWSANLGPGAAPSVAERTEYTAYLLDLCQPDADDGGKRVAEFLQKRAEVRVEHCGHGPNTADHERAYEAACAAWEALPAKACLYYLTREGDSEDPRWAEADDALQASIPSDLHCYESLIVNAGAPK